MSNTLTDLTTAQVMVNAPSSFMSDGLSTAGVQKSDLERGFVKETLNEDYRVDADGTNYVGDPYIREGFAGVNSKYKRI